MIWSYLLLAAVLTAVELFYFCIADHFNIIDKPNERSSHSTIVLRGGGVIFTLAMWVWFAFFGVASMTDYLPFLVGLTLVAVVSFWDDVRSLSDSVRLVAQFVAMVLMFWSMGILHWELWWFVPVALVVCVGAMNIINFMDGINGITGGYALAVLAPLFVLNRGSHGGFIAESYLIVAILGVLVFCWFNFRPRGKAKCFAGDVGSIGIAFILLFALGRLIVDTRDLSYLMLLGVYGVDGVCTILHRVMLHEHLGQAHRKHAFQLLSNELGWSHVTVSLLYMGIQLLVSAGLILLPVNHYVYAVAVLVALCLVYLLFMKKYYHLHEEYLASLEK